MNRHLFPRFLVFILGAVVFSSLLRISLKDERSAPKYDRFSLGTGEDPGARARYEWMMQRDPKTNRIPDDIRKLELAFAKTLPTAEAFAEGQGLRKGQLTTWSPRGPVNQGGRTRALAINVSNISTILAGGISGGMWRSTDGGASWTRTTSFGDSVQSVTCIAQDTRSGKTNTWYYGTGEWLGNSSSGGGASYNGDGIFKSTDGGASWTVLSSTHGSRPQPPIDNFFDFVWNIAIDPSNTSEDVVYAATVLGLLRSTNGGATWSVIGGAFSNSGPQFTDVAVTSTGVVYASVGTLALDGSNTATDAGLYRSPDGVTWNSIAPLDWPSTTRRIVIGIAPSNENVVYFLAETPGSGTLNHGLWKYTDNDSGTGTWENRSVNIPAFGGQVGDFSSQGSYDLLIKVKPDTADVVFIGGTNLYRSTDGFATSGNTAWIGGYSTANDVSVYANHHPDQHSLTFLPGSPSVMFSGHDGGLSKTTNDVAASVVWTTLNNGYRTSQFYSVAIDQATSGNAVVIGGLQDNGNMFSNTTNAGTPWVVLPAGGDGGIDAIANGRTSYYIETQNGNLIRLILDPSGTYTNFAVVKPGGASGFLFIAPYVLDANNSNIMYLAAGDRVWRNSDLTGIPFGNQDTTSINWTDLTNTAVSGSLVSSVAVSKSPADRLYYGTYDGRLFRVNNASTGNPTPTEVTAVSFPSGGWVSCIGVNPRNADTAVAVFSNYSVQSLFLTTDGGTSWANISGNLEQNPDGSGSGPSCRWATILPFGGTVRYYVGTSTGLYTANSLNGASTVWSQEGASPIGNVVVSMVVSRQLDGTVVVATHANGVFSGVVSTAVDEHPPTTPLTFALEQNFPNPFNPSTTIRYSIAQRAAVVLAVYDIVGREVARLVDSEEPAGTYKTVWNGTNSQGAPVSSGVYFYRLETRPTDGVRAEGRAETWKMLLLK